MATASRAVVPALNTINGKVTVKESGTGIPNLLVVIYDLDPGVRNEEGLSSNPPVVPPTISIHVPETSRIEYARIASIITDVDGAFQVQFADHQFRVLDPNEKRPDLLVQVLAPEDADSTEPPKVLFSSKLLRVNSGMIEGYLIRIPGKFLTEAGLPIPALETEDQDVDTKVKRFKARKTTERNLREGLRTANTELEMEVSEETKLLRENLKKTIIPNTAFLNSLPNFVSDSKTIEEVHDTVIKTGSQKITDQLQAPQQPTPGKGIKINLILTDSEKANLAAFKISIGDDVYYNLPEDQVNQILRKRETDGGINSILFSNNPISKFCIQHSTEEKCAKEHLGLTETAENTGSGTGSGGSHNHNGGTGSTGNGSATNGPLTGINATDIPMLLEQVLLSKEASHFHTDFKQYENDRPTSKSVQESVDKFALQKGPADATAFYDFHSLQIAFQHVWQQLLDETLVNLSEKINTEQENSGRKGILQQLKDKITVIKSPNVNLLLSIIEEAHMLYPEEIPTNISAAFDISFPEYDALTADNKKRLGELATSILKFEAMATQEPRGPQGGITVGGFGLQGFAATPPTSHYHAARALVLREQGERIIDNIRINKPFSTNQLLKDLQSRLLSKYEFTIFAANKDYHSVNFGLMNTYRQKWEPISYQAGKLVKTVPLSPKEERKYAVKTTHNLKVTRKEARKNNSSLQQEINTTSRAESEIVAKAHDKSNFNMSVKLDYSKISSELTFGKEADKESAQTKKDFRESVIKAAQEYKEERSLEIDTEETSSSEYTESGTIVNPNDELSVTYLFYELQRRYRVSEQLYRVMPVVLVAQEVPSPDQITEAWIIAHDWILNRALLDDSFRPTLQYLAQKNVGDDFAIRELRKNLRQQRTLVNNLQIEFAKLKTLVDNKYAMLQNTVSERIDEEHQKRFYKWWWWIGRDKPDTPPDPEMAKALEQAAADDHKHAVEQAEKMAMAVQREVSTLQQLTVEYNTVMRDHLDRITQSRRLITHIKENILYYMQAIWSLEPPDQRFMRMHKVKLPVFEAERTCLVDDKAQPDIFAQFRGQDKKKYRGWLHAKVKRKEDGTPEVQYKDLVEIADLDSVLGFKGNYMIFPMKEHNPLTELMAAPYVDEAFGAMDPDELSNVNLTEFSKYICCLHNEHPEEYDKLKDVLKEWLKRLLADPLRNGDEIIVPTGSLFIEMLPSDKSLLENFKLQHREWDVYKVQADVRRLELENIRYAARLLNDERGDPDTEKKVIVDGVKPIIDADN